MTIHHRAYSLLRVKAADDEKREITGIATTPTIDRVGDSIDPLGMRYRNPLPLLLHHDQAQPVGQAFFQRATSDGIPFRAALPRIDEPGTVQDRVDEAWHSIKHRLIGAVSVGFRVEPGGIEPLENGGLRFTKTECMELSLCAIPANPEAVITGVKAFDAEIRAAYARKPAYQAIEYLGTRISPEEQRIMDVNGWPQCLQRWQLPPPASSTASARSSRGSAAPPKEWLEMFAKAIFENIHEYVQPAVNELARRISELETQQRAMRYRGVWQPAEQYERGNFVTHDGSLWIAIDERPAKPGQAGWQLCAKRGRDAA